MNASVFQVEVQIVWGTGPTHNLDCRVFLLPNHFPVLDSHEEFHYLYNTSPSLFRFIQAALLLFAVRSIQASLLVTIQLNVCALKVVTSSYLSL